MKRFMSVALATAMIASMGITAFAETDYYYKSKHVELDNTAFAIDNSGELTADDETDDGIPDELYFVLELVQGGKANDNEYPVATKANPLHITDGGKNGTVRYDDIEDVDDLKVNIKFTDGEEYVADYYIDEIDDAAAGVYNGCYAVIVELNDNYTTKKQKIKGEVVLKNKSNKNEERDFSYTIDIEKLTVDEDRYTEFEGMGEDEKTSKYGECEFDEDEVSIHLIDFNGKWTVADFDANVENIELEDDNGFYFDVKASDQGKLNLTYDNVAIKSVARMAPVDADLTFYNFYGYPEFDFTGKVTLTPEEDDVEYFVYSVAKDGSISKINAKLNDDGDAYEFKTRTLGCYVLSDMELDVEEDAAVEAPVVDDAPVAEDAVVVAPETGKTNPGTGC